MKAAPLVHDKIIGVVQVRHTKEERLSAKLPAGDHNPAAATFLSC